MLSLKFSSHFILLIIAISLGSSQCSTPFNKPKGAPKRFPKGRKNSRKSKATAAAQKQIYLPDLNQAQRDSIIPELDFTKFKAVAGSQLDFTKEKLYEEAFSLHNRAMPDLGPKKAQPMLAVEYKDPDYFKLTSKQTPQYFKAQIKLHSSEFTVKNNYYDYEDGTPEHEVFYVDFANRHLGGGHLGRGFVQEEIMFVQFPQLASYALLDAKGQKLTRVGGESPLHGSPAPLVFRYAQLAFDTTIGNSYGNLSKLEHAKTSDLFSLRPKTKRNDVHILAIAAPRLRSTNEQASLEVIQDYLNTAYAGFHLAKLSTPPGMRTVIATGKFGCGIFGNHPAVSIVLQALAGKLADVDIVFHTKPATNLTKENELQKTLLSEIDPTSTTQEALRKIARHLQNYIRNQQTI